MTDRYKFRGKRVDNGKWVVGSLVKGCTSGVVQIYESCTNLAGYVVSTVDPATVGMLLDAEDVNKQKPFQGDRLIVWCQGSRQAGTVTITSIRDFYTMLDGGDSYTRATKFEILNNIHDNPDMEV